MDNGNRMYLPTPSDSQKSGSASTEEAKPISMSTTFYPRDDHPSDLIVVSSDIVFFSVHGQTLLSKSNNHFSGLLLQEDCMACSVSEDASIFNLVLHAIYNYNPENYDPTLDQITQMLDCLPKYGISVDSVLILGSPFSDVLLRYARIQTLETYTLVCYHRIEALAVEVSQHLLSVPMHNLTDLQCARMGPVYLRRLIFLQLGRIERLKILLKELPSSHPPTPICNEEDQKRLMFKQWNAATSEAFWDINPDTSDSVLRTTLNPVADRLLCAECQKSTKERIQSLVADWAKVKKTI